VLFLIGIPFASALFCCVSGDSGCTPEATAADCPAGSLSIDIEAGESCADVDQCDYGACCGESIPQGEYLKTRYECSVAYGSTDNFTPIGPWEFDESVYQSQANTICSGETISQCQYTSCDGANTEPCYCGSELLDPASGAYCCAQFDHVGSSQGTCSAPYVGTPYCSPQELYSISGTVQDTNGNPIQGAVVVVGSKSVTTSSAGSYEVANVSGGSGYIYVSKLGYETASEQYQIATQDIQKDFTLETVASTQQELCDNLVDDDGDDAIDYCDVDCNSDLATNYVFENESTFQTPEANCTDGIDNDCDGLIDCSDPNCDEHESCRSSFCGDGVCDEDLENAYSCPQDCGTPISVCGDGIRQEGEDCEFERSGSDWIQIDNQTRPVPEDQEVPPCGSPNSSSPCKFMPTCGNDIIEYGEECEPDITEGNPCPGACSATQCECSSYQVCGDGIVTGTEECEAGRTSNCGTAGCDTNNCLCNLGCEYRPLVTNITGAVSSQDEPKVTVSWGNSGCQEYIEKFILTRCEVNPDNPLENCDAITEYDTTQEFSGETFSFEDTSVETSSEYCYRLATVYDSTTYDGAAPFSEKVCVTTGDDICYTVGDSFCRDNKVFSCDPSTNRVRGTADDDCGSPQLYPPSQFYEYQCQETQSGAQCTEVSKCSICNGLFEMFYYDGKARNLQGSLVDCLSFSHCHVDYSSTAVDKYYQCSKVHDCYDYASENACVSNSCGLLSECEWNPFYEGTSIGVCSPTNESEQKCERCSSSAENLFDTAHLSSSDPLFDRKASPDKKDTPYNKFFGECSSDSCALYGSCLYSDDVCRPLANAGCHDYATKEECVNWPNNNITGPQEIGIDTNAYAGTNQIITESDDRFGFGLCRWDNNHCFKDGDDNGEDDCQVINKNDPAYRECVSDLTPPNTTLDVGTRVSDNMSIYLYVEKGAETYACLTEAGKRCYPVVADPYRSRLRYDNATGQERMHLGADQILYQGFDESENPLPMKPLSATDLNSGDYTLYYFSSDINHNLEEVKETEFFVDATEPVVEIETETVVDRSETPWTNNLSITFESYDKEAPDFYGEVVCSIRLITENDPQEVYPAYSINERPGNTWELFYPTLKDGVYYIDYECTDAVGNVAQDHYMIELEGDKSITNILPRGPLKQTTVEITADTQYAGECRYDDELVRFEAMDADQTLQSDPSGKQHSITLNNLEENELHRYYIACSFDNGQFTELNPHDAAVFSIDTLPPRVQLETIPTPYDANGELWYNNGSIDQQGVQYTLTCLDQAIYDPMTNIDWSFGCQSLFFCASGSTGCTPTTTNSIVYRNVTNETAYLSYYGIDSGENEPTYENKDIDIPLRYDDVSPTFEIQLYDGDRPIDKVSAKTYDIEVTSSEPLRKNRLRVGFETGSCDVDASDFTSSDNMVWNGKITIPNQNRCEDINGNASFFVFGVDAHNRAGNEIINGSSIYVDTTPPQDFALEPVLEDYSNYKYPLRYDAEEDVYYTGDNQLYVSGFTEEPLTVEAYKNNTNPPYSPLYGHSEPTLVFEDALMEAEGTAVYVDGDITQEIDSSLFLDFSTTGAFRRDYKNYKKHYDIIDVEYVSEQELDRTKITISPPLPGPVTNGDVLFYDSIYPSQYFGGSIKLKPFTYTNVFFRVRDVVNNTLRHPESPEFLTFYCDPTKPEYIEDTIVPTPDSATNNPEQVLSIQFRKPTAGVGIQSMDLTATAPGNFTLASDEVRDNYHYYTLEYHPSEPMNGTVTARAEVTDNAGNYETYEWTFDVDTTLPSVPYVSINNSLEYEGKVFSDTAPEVFSILFRDTYDIELLDFSLTPDISLTKGNVECMLGTRAENEVRSRLGLDEVEIPEQTTDPFQTTGVVTNESITDETLEPFRTEHDRLKLFQFLLEEDLGQNDYLCILDTADPSVQSIEGCLSGSSEQPCTYDARIQARKILSEEAATTGEFKQTIVLDTKAPSLSQSSLVGTTSIRPGSTLDIEVNVPNEPHGLDGQIEFINETYDLPTISLNGTRYLLQWDIPGSVEQGTYLATITYQDPLGNSNDVAKEFIVDVFPPNTDNISIRILNDDLIKKFNDSYVTKDANVMKLNGELQETDIVRASATIEDELYEGQVNTFSDSTTFYLEVPIKSNAQGEDRTNTIEVTLIDQAGYESTMTVTLIKDLSPPVLQGRRLLDRFAFGNFG
jgi:hypothetical protein